MATSFLPPSRWAKEDPYTSSKPPATVASLAPVTSIQSVGRRRTAVHDTEQIVKTKHGKISRTYSASDFHIENPHPDDGAYLRMKYMEPGAIDILRAYWDRYLPKTGRILDVCSSGDSPHFPATLRPSLLNKTLDIRISGSHDRLLAANPWSVKPYIITDLNTYPQQLITKFENLFPYTAPSMYQFDTITNLLNIHCLESPVQVLGGLWRLAKPGGTIHLVVNINSRLDELCTTAWREASASKRLRMLSDFLKLAA
ncbi:hypothetical protein HD806DRAFT_553305 [Xylariaceae sp. AK1471]|nr:hypothetical protein HD806DRAFT_553305 [Xylariaceae sp. AK1471]